MKGLLAANVRHHGRRYVATGLAVTIAVVFVVLVLSLGNSTGAAMKRTFSDQYSGAAAVVEFDPEDSGTPPTEAEMLQKISAVPEVGEAASVTAVYAEFDGGTAQGSISQLLPEPFFRPSVETGVLPDAVDQIALDARTAKALQVEVGDTVSVASLFSEAADGADDLTVVGIYGKSGNSLFSMSADSATMTQQGLAALDEENRAAFVDHYLLSASGDQSEEAVVAAVADQLDGTGLHAVTVSEAIDRAMEDVNMSVAQMGVMLMVFPAIAIVVAIIVISTTFQVIVQQRQRELGLLRCIGASGRQVRRLIVGESLAVGAVASLLGVILGALLAALGTSAIGLLPSFAAGLAAIGWSTLLGVFAAGVLITVVAGFRPAMRVGKIPPLAALSPAEQGGGGSRSGGWWVRLVLGGLIAIGGGAGMMVIAPQQTEASFLGSIGLGLVTLFGLVLFLSAVFPDVVAAAASPLRGMLGRMAAGNALRAPGRTAATGVSVVIGVTLIVMMMVGASSLRATMDAELDSRMATDLIATSSSGEALSQADADAIARVPGIAEVAAERSLTEGVTLGGDPIGVYDVDAMQRVARSPLTLPGDGQVMIPGGMGFASGEATQLCGPAGCQDVTVMIDTSWVAEYGTAGITADLLTELGGEPQVMRILAQMENTSDFQVVSADIARATDGYELGGAAQMRAMFDQMINAVLAVVVALLGVSVLVALVGVSNTMSLSVAERTRENGLLRALGMTKRQVSRMLTLEAVIISLTAALLGALAGVFFGWIGINAIPLDLDGVLLVVPWLQVAAVLGVAIVAAVLASWIPGRRAARTSPVEALAVE